jgi:hypothetical protein
MNAAHLLVGTLVAQPGGDRGGGLNFNVEGLVQAGIQYLVPLILLAAGIGIMLMNRQGNYQGVFSRVGIIFVGLIVIAAGTALYSFAEGLTDLMFT